MYTQLVITFLAAHCGSLCALDLSSDVLTVECTEQAMLVRLVTTKEWHGRMYAEGFARDNGCMVILQGCCNRESQIIGTGDTDQTMTLKLNSCGVTRERTVGNDCLTLFTITSVSWIRAACSSARRWSPPATTCYSQAATGPCGCNASTWRR